MHEAVQTVSAIVIVYWYFAQMPGYVGGTVKERGSAALAKPSERRAWSSGSSDSYFDGAERPFMPTSDPFRLSSESGPQPVCPSLASQSSDFERIDRPRSTFSDRSNMNQVKPY